MEYTLVTSNYFNSGGNCMVLQDIYKDSTGQQIYVSMADEDVIVATIDLFGEDFTDEQLAAATLLEANFLDFDERQVINNSQYNMIINNSFQRLIQFNSKIFDTVYAYEFWQLPLELQSLIPAEDLLDIIENGLLVATDGCTIKYTV